MSDKRSYIEDADGNRTHVRDTSSDGRTSYIYEAKNDLLSRLPFGRETGNLVEKQAHDEDGTTRTVKRYD